MKLAAAFFVAMLVSVFAQAQTCEIPPEYANQTTVVESDLWVGFATDKMAYSPAEIVEFYLVVKNVGASTVYINWGVDPQDGIFVLPQTCTSLDQAGCLDEALFFFPSMVYYFSAGTRLEPGECRVWAEAWGMARDGVPNGTYNVFGGMCKVSFVEPISVDFVVPDQGAKLTIIVDSALPVENSTWGGIKALYES